MSHNVFDWYLKSDIVFKNCLKIILDRIYSFDNVLTHDYLIYKGWVLDEDTLCYYEPDVKKKEKVFIRLKKNGFYDVLLGENYSIFKTEKSIEWFELFMLLKHRDNGFYDIIGSKL